MHDREANGRTNGDAAVLEAIRSIRYASVEIIIHEVELLLNLDIRTPAVDT